MHLLEADLNRFTAGGTMAQSNSLILCRLLLDSRERRWANNINSSQLSSVDHLLNIFWAFWLLWLFVSFLVFYGDVFFSAGLLMDQVVWSFVSLSLLCVRQILYALFQVDPWHLVHLAYWLCDFWLTWVQLLFVLFFDLLDHFGLILKVLVVAHKLLKFELLSTTAEWETCLRSSLWILAHWHWETRTWFDDWFRRLETRGCLCQFAPASAILH